MKKIKLILTLTIILKITKNNFKKALRHKLDEKKT